MKSLMRLAPVVLRKELSEILSNRMLLLSLASLPAVMVAVSLFILWTYVAGADRPEIEAIARWYVPEGSGRPTAAALVEVTIRNSVGLFLGMPVFLPVLIAAQSVAGEKERRTLEPLLATPVKAMDVVLGKSLAAVIPAYVITLLAFAIFAVGADVIAWPVLGRLALPDPSFLFAVLVLSPLLAFFGNCVSVLISSRVSDSRLAQSLAGLVVMPFFGVVTLQFAGLLSLGPSAHAALAVGTLAADAALLALAVRLFDRDRLLTRWA